MRQVQNNLLKSPGHVRCSQSAQTAGSERKGSETQTHETRRTSRSCPHGGIPTRTKSRERGKPLLLETKAYSVTSTASDAGFEVAKHRCRCWFCPDCCRILGLDLRKRLEPILETFNGLLMVTFTVDPSLFIDAAEAYFYMRDRRCIARTIQDLDRAGYLHSRRYFYVVEWQKHTEQAHFHVLLDASYIPWQFLLDSWSKHRPETAGPVVPGRPAFGTVLVSKPRFSGGAAHAARYVTKYLTKTPEHGFPIWVLRMGMHTRIRRYSTSREFWGKKTLPSGHGKPRDIKRRSYRQRLEQCGSSVDLYEFREAVDRGTGEIETRRRWIGELAVPARELFDRLHNSRDVRRFRRSLIAATSRAAVQSIEQAVGYNVRWIAGGPPCVSG